MSERSTRIDARMATAFAITTALLAGCGSGGPPAPGTGGSASASSGSVPAAAPGVPPPRRAAAGQSHRPTPSVTATLEAYFSGLAAHDPSVCTRYVDSNYLAATTQMHGAAAIAACQRAVTSSKTSIKLDRIVAVHQTGSSAWASVLLLVDQKPVQRTFLLRLINGRYLLDTALVPPAAKPTTTPSGAAAAPSISPQQGQQARQAYDALLGYIRLADHHDPALCTTYLDANDLHALTGKSGQEAIAACQDLISRSQATPQLVRLEGISVQGSTVYLQVVLSSGTTQTRLVFRMVNQRAHYLIDGATKLAPNQHK